MALTNTNFAPDTFNYDNAKYDFETLVSELFDTKSLDKIVDPDFKPNYKLNNTSHYHKLFYDKLYLGWCEFETLYTKFINNVVFKMIKYDFCYQTLPSILINYPNSRKELPPKTKENNDHPEEEIQFLIPLTSVSEANALWSEHKSVNKNLESELTGVGELLEFKKSKLELDTHTNKTDKTSVFLKFCIIPYDKYTTIKNHKYSNNYQRQFIIGDYYKKLLLKLYFPPAWGWTSRQLLDDYKRQTPNNSGCWNNFLEGTDNIDDADILIIQDECSIKEFNHFEPNNRYYFSREALDRHSYYKYKDTGLIDCSFWNKKDSYLWTKWIYNNKNTGGIGKSYDELKAILPPIKTKKVCCILSNKRVNEGHNLRVDFMSSMMKKYGHKIDLYGGVDCANLHMLNNDKFECLKQYEYCIAFDNQDDIEKFFGTQFTDAMLCYTVPIYWGGSNNQLIKYFPLLSFETFNVRDLNEMDRIISIVNSNSYESRLNAICEARNKIIEKYNMWPTIEYEIKNNESNESEILSCQFTHPISANDINVICAEMYNPIDGQKGRGYKQDETSQFHKQYLRTIKCNDCDIYEKCSGAGDIISIDRYPYQKMFNGLLIYEGGYHSRWMTNIIKELKGHHEPQDECLFIHIVRNYIPPKSTMIELGSFWGYYSLIFKKEISDAHCYLVEPIIDKLKIGKHNFDINGYKGTFVNAHINSKRSSTFMDWDSEEIKVKGITLDDIFSAYHLNKVQILHSDIQGTEYEMLDNCVCLSKGKIDFLFIGTHGANWPIIEKLMKYNYHTLFSMEVNETFADDGLVVACRQDLKNSVSLPPISRFKKSNS